jgi:hypothetical protein
VLEPLADLTVQQAVTQALVVDNKTEEEEKKVICFEAL